MSKPLPTIHIETIIQAMEAYYPVSGGEVAKLARAEIAALQERASDPRLSLRYVGGIGDGDVPLFACSYRQITEAMASEMAAEKCITAWVQDMDPESPSPKPQASSPSEVPA